MKSMAVYWKFALGILVIVSLIFTTCWPAIRFAHELQQAIDKQSINKLIARPCRAINEMLTQSNENSDLKFHIGLEELDTAPNSYGGCFKKEFDGISPSPESAQNGKLHLTSDDIANIRDSLRASYFVHSAGHTNITSDAVFFYETDKNKFYAIYYWQSRSSVSIAIWDNSSEHAQPVVRTKIWPNKFTDMLYDKFILEKSPQ